MSISLEQQDWLKQFLDLVLERYNAEAAVARAQALPEEDRGLLAVHSSLAASGAAFGLPTIDPSLSESGDFPSIKFLSTLKHQVEIVFDVATALGGQHQGDYGRVSACMILCAVLGDFDRSDWLAQSWQAIMSGNHNIEETITQLEDQYPVIGQALINNALLKDDPLLALPVNQGISYFDIYLAGRLAVDLHGDGKLERHEVEHTLTITHKDRIHFVEAIIALAWSNGLLEAEERNLIKKQVQMLNLTKKESRKLINLMITPSTPKEFAQAFSSYETGMFVMRQLTIASLIDGSQDAREQKFLLQTSKEFGLSESDFHTLQGQVKQFVAEHSQAIEQIKNYRRTRR